MKRCAKCKPEDDSEPLHSCLNLAVAPHTFQPERTACAQQSPSTASNFRGTMASSASPAPAPAQAEPTTLLDKVSDVDIDSEGVFKCVHAPWAVSQSRRAGPGSRTAARFTPTRHAPCLRYVLIKVTDTGSSESKYVVRGYEFAEYHQDVYNKAKSDELREGLEMQVAGGGRIRHTPPADEAQGELFVYGYSVAFGRAEHEQSVALLKAAYPAYKVTFSNEGY